MVCIWRPHLHQQFSGASYRYSHSFSMQYTYAHHVSNWITDEWPHMDGFIRVGSRPCVVCAYIHMHSALSALYTCTYTNIHAHILRLKIVSQVVQRYTSATKECVQACACVHVCACVCLCVCVVTPRAFSSLFHTIELLHSERNVFVSTMSHKHTLYTQYNSARRCIYRHAHSNAEKHMHRRT